VNKPRYVTQVVQGLKTHKVVCL